MFSSQQDGVKHSLIINIMALVSNITKSKFCRIPPGQQTIPFQKECCANNEMLGYLQIKDSNYPVFVSKNDIRF